MVCSFAEKHNVHVTRNLSRGKVPRSLAGRSGRPREQVMSNGLPNLKQEVPKVFKVARRAFWLPIEQKLEDVGAASIAGLEE
jgi:hypothetical protein